MANLISIEQERKFLIKSFADKASEKLVLSSKSFEIIQWYLPRDDQNRSPRVRLKYYLTPRGPVNTFFYTRKKSISPGICEEEEKEINFKEFNKLIKKADPKKTAVEKTRYILPYEGNIFEFDMFKGLNKGLMILEVELENMASEIKLPNYFIIDKEVTGDKSYSNRSLADRKK